MNKYDKREVPKISKQYLFLFESTASQIIKMKQYVLDQDYNERYVPKLKRKIGQNMKRRPGGRRS